MNEILGRRVEELMNARGLSQSELARRVGIQQPSIGRLISGDTRSSRHLVQIARELDTTPEYLLGETDDDAPNSLQAPRLGFRGAQPEQADTVDLRELDLAFGMGGTFLDVPVKSNSVAFSRAWLRNFSDSAPDKLFFARGSGDSMMPTILDSDIVLIDTEQQNPVMGDRLWAIAYGEVGMIKRLRPMPDGSIKILSDNQNVPPETAFDGELHVIGRVVAVVRKT